MFNPHSDQHLGRLRSVLKNSKAEMEKAYNDRLHAQKEWLGRRAPYKGTAGNREINLLDLAKMIYKQFLVPQNPRSSLTPRKRELVPDAYSFELAVNAVLGEEYVNAEADLAVDESMFGPLGVMKIFHEAEDSVTLDGVRVSIGRPKLKAVTFDNWVQDMSAGHPEAVAFCGDRYYMERDDALLGGMFDPDVVQKLKGEDRRQPDWTESQSLRELRFFEDYREMLELWDIWLPYEGLLLTLAGNFDEGAPLRVVEWSGPKDGPYERLYYSLIAGNSLPNPPVAMWVDLHETENRIWNKCVRQADRQKTNDVVRSGDPKAQEILKGAKDGEMLALSDLQIKETLRSGGADPVNMNLVPFIKQLFTYMSGNLDSLGGLQAQSGTAKQDEMLTEGASQRLRQMQARVRDFMRRITRQIASHLWESPLLDVPIEKRVGDMSINSMWSRDQMGGEFPDYLVDIDPYSLGTRTPQERLMQLDEFWRVDVPQLLPVMQMQGIMPNVENYIKAKAKLADLPELEEMVTFAQGEMAPGNDDMLKKPDTTTRRYERVSRAGGKTQQGGEQEFMQNMMALAKSNGAQ